MPSQFPILRLMACLRVGAAILGEQDGDFLACNDLFQPRLELIAPGASTLSNLFERLSAARDCKIFGKGEDRYALFQVPGGPLLLVQHFHGVQSLWGPRFDLLLLFDQSEAPVPDPSVLRAAFHFSRTEATVGVLLSRGLTVREVAKETHTAEATVRTHLKSMFDKCSVNSQAKLLIVLRRMALLPSLEDARRIQ